MEVHIGKANNVFNIENFNGRLSELQGEIVKDETLPAEVREEVAAEISKAMKAAHTAPTDPAPVKAHLDKAGDLLTSAGKMVGGATVLAKAVAAIGVAFGLGL